MDREHVARAAERRERESTGEIKRDRDGVGRGTESLEAEGRREREGENSPWIVLRPGRRKAGAPE